MAAIIKNDKRKLIHNIGFLRILVCDARVCFLIVFIEGMKNNIPRKDKTLIIAHKIKDDCQLNREAIKVAIGTPITLAIVNPPKTIETPFEDCPSDKVSAPTERAIDQNNGCKNAGNDLTAKRILKLDANTQTIFEIAKTPKTNNKIFFLLNDDNKSTVNGPDIATISAKRLKSHPALSIVIEKAFAICGKIPITLNSVVPIPNVPKAKR